MELNTLRTNAALEVDGAWVEIDPANETKAASRVLIARWGNKNMVKALNKLQRKYRTMIQRDSMPEDLNDKVMREVVADTVFLAFDGPWTNEGKPLVDSRDTRLAMLAVRDFYQIVAGFAADMSLFREQDEAEALGNSPSESAGTAEPE